MPIESIAVVGAVLALFAVFAITLTIADMTWEAKVPGRVRK